MDSETKVLTLPILPIKRTVLFPGVMMPLTVGRERSMAAVQAAMKTEEKMILVVAQRDSQTEEPGLSDLYTIGTKAIIKQIGQSSSKSANPRKARFMLLSKAWTALRSSKKPNRPPMPSRGSDRWTARQRPVRKCRPCIGQFKSWSRNSRG